VPKSDRKWIITGIVALAIVIVGCLPISRCPACRGACGVESIINGEKEVCGYCADRRITPIKKAWLLWSRR